MTNDKYDPKLSEAGFMDLVVALQNLLKQPATIKLLAAKPAGMVNAARTLERAAIAYVDAVEGRSEAQEPITVTVNVGDNQRNSGNQLPPGRVQINAGHNQRNCGGDFIEM